MLATRGSSSTPVNEMVCATFSPPYGWWNEQLASDRPFVTALKHLVTTANTRAMRSIPSRRGDALFIQSESSDLLPPPPARAIGPGPALNAFLSLDLFADRRVESGDVQYLLDNGMTRAGTTASSTTASSTTA